SPLGSFGRQEGIKLALAFGLAGMCRLDVLVGDDHALGAMAGEKAPAPVYQGTDLLFGAVEQGEVDTEPGEPGDVPGQRAAPGNLDPPGAVTPLSHDALVDVTEWLRLPACHQAFDRIADVPARLQGHGAKARQHLARLAVRHRRDVADGKDAPVAIDL